MIAIIGINQLPEGQRGIESSQAISAGSTMAKRSQDRSNVETAAGERSMSIAGRGRSTATAKLFMSGRSQAVRLPKAFRFEGTEVRVSRQGEKVILEPLERKPFDVKAWRARLDALGAEDFLPDGVPDEPPPLGPADEVPFD